LQGILTTPHIALQRRPYSKAPILKASIVAVAPLTVRLDSITTGMGRRVMILWRNCRPLIPGISMSRVRTSGLRATALLASRPPPKLTLVTSRNPANHLHHQHARLRLYSPDWTQRKRLHGPVAHERD